MKRWRDVGMPRQNQGGIPYSIEIVTTGLQVPWALDFTPDGRIFLTERPGRVRVVAQGRMAWDPRTRILYSSEHGDSGHDEINLIQAGGNYGWPIIEGDERRESLVRPLIHSGNRTWAPSGMTFVTRGPWRNQLLVANLRGSQILRLSIEEGRPRSIRLLSSFFVPAGGFEIS